MQIPIFAGKLCLRALFCTYRKPIISSFFKTFSHIFIFVTRWNWNSVRFMRVYNVKILFIKADFAGVCKTLATTDFLQIFRTGKPLPLGLGWEWGQTRSTDFSTYESVYTMLHQKSDKRWFNGVCRFFGICPNFCLSAFLLIAVHLHTPVPLHCA